MILQLARVSAATRRTPVEEKSMALNLGHGFIG
jgi:hypothetical protein